MFKKRKNKNQKENLNEQEHYNDYSQLNDNEIIIGVTRLDAHEEEKEKKKKRKIKNKPKKEIKQPKKKKKHIRLNLFGKIFFTLTTLLIITFGLTIFLLTSPMFNLTQIKVIGNNKFSNEEIINMSKIKIGTNVFKIKKHEIFEHIKKNPYIESVEINRMLPDMVELVITERIETYTFYINDEKVFINNQGYILEKSYDKEDKIIINGFKTPENQIICGNRLNNEDLIKLDSIIKIVERCNSNNIANKISNIYIDNNEFIINFDEENKTAYIGDLTNITTKILYVKEIMEKEKDHSGKIFVNMDLNKSNPYFRQEG